MSIATKLFSSLLAVSAPALASPSWGSGWSPNVPVHAVPSSYVPTSHGSYNATASSYKPSTSASAWNYNAASLSQSQTNGASTWGTFSQESLSGFLNGPMPGGYGVPWGGRTCGNTNPYSTSDIPNTGMTRYYTWTVSNVTMAPDGVETPMLVVNNQFPGPLIEANWGDWIEVTITNNLTEGTAMHWHGFLQTGTPYYDGVPGVSQCPIAPGKSFTYRFRAELYGTSWWHGHWSAQYINGMAGPIVVHGPTNADYDIDLGPVMLSDWFHDYYVNLLEKVFVASEFGPIFPPMANNMLIQGKANYNCSNTNATCTPDAGLAQFKFQSGKKHLLRLINHSAEAIIFFSIDGYTVTIIANDFVPVVPYETDLVTLAVGQRTDIIVEATGKSTDAVWMRITEGPSGLGPEGDTGCSLNDGLAFTTTAAIYYEDADTKILPNTTSSIDDSRYLFPLACQNQPLNDTVPEFVMALPEPSTQIDIIMEGIYNSSGDFVWIMNNVTFYTDYNDPTLLEAKLGNYSFPTERAVYNMGNNTSVRINMTSVGFPASHPMHIHGHNMYVLAAGFGYWDGSIVNASNPQRRDTQLIAPAGYLVIQIDLDNPGVWPFHCHVAWHISEGMNINILEQPDKVVNELEVPMVMAQTCRDWADYTNGHVVDQIDSGL